MVRPVLPVLSVLLEPLVLRAPLVPLVLSVPLVRLALSALPVLRVLWVLLAPLVRLGLPVLPVLPGRLALRARTEPLPPRRPPWRTSPPRPRPRRRRWPPR